MPYLTCSYETHYANVLEEFPDLRDDHNGKGGIMGGTGSGAELYERWARLSPQYRGEYPVDNVTVRKTWLRPAAFNILDKDRAKEMKKLFPDGAYVCMINDEYASSCNESLDDHWTVSFNPLADFVTGMEFLRTVGLSSGTTVNTIFGANALANFLSNDKVKGQADFRNIKRVDIGMPMFDNTTGLIYHGQIAAGDFIINIWTYNDSYEDVSGVDQKYLDADAVVMVPDDFVGVTAYAGIPTVFGDPISGNQVIKPQKGEMVLHDVIDQVKKTWQLILESAPVAIPVSVDRIYTIKTR